MARYNERPGRVYAKTLAKEFSGNAGKTKATEKAIAFMYQALLGLSSSEQSTVLKHVMGRLVTEGDRFATLVNLAPIHEVIIGIKVGVYKTAEDIEQSDVFKRRLNKGADLRFSNVYGQDISMQIKGDSGYIRVSPNSKIVLKPNGQLDREASIGSILAQYFKGGPNRMAFPMSYGSHSAAAYFDLGGNTFKRISKKYPTWFNPTLAKKDMAIKTENFTAEIEKIMKEHNIDTEGFRELQKITNSKMTKEQKDLKEILRDAFLDQRKKEWIRSGRIYFKLTPDRQKIMANDPSLSPLISTGIKRYEDHEPFYSIINQIYGSGGMGAYLYNNPMTEGNKSAKYYYNNIYQNINY